MIAASKSQRFCTAPLGVLCSAVLTASDLIGLLAEWRLALTAERKSPATIILHLTAVNCYLTGAANAGLAPMRRTNLEIGPGSSALFALGDKSSS